MRLNDVYCILFYYLHFYSVFLWCDSPVFAKVMRFY
nr:MAG TPA: hypothetical protein [Caudoviricetes sp.]